MSYLGIFAILALLVVTTYLALYPPFPPADTGGF